MATRTYVTVVSGLPRSGTSMMMRMLAEGGLEPLADHHRAADPDNPLGYYEFEPVKRTKQDASWVPLAVGKVVKAIHLFLPELPLSHQYRVILMRRDLREVVRSQNLMLERRQKPSTGLSVERLMAIYQTQLDQVREHLRRHPEQFRLLEVDYNEVMRDPRPATEAVAKFLDGLDLEKMLAVVEPSLYRQRAGT
ncbi:MAG: sulfotransferase [Candidatus Riflebacteria bacterium]|nr:sulfotransferase [Candidatus Riflebacteria bacterium]